MYQVVKRAKEVFGDNVVCIGSPFEADHQLASLFHQNIIDYVVTVDSDLIFFGVDVIFEMNNKGECWMMITNKLLETRLPQKIGTDDNVIWTRDILNHMACFLGNDYIRRLYGNGPTKVKPFVDELWRKIKEPDGAVEEFIRATIEKSRDISTEEERSNHRLWNQCRHMFKHGPAFVAIGNKRSDISLRESFSPKSLLLSWVATVILKIYFHNKMLKRIVLCMDLIHMQIW